ncbi:unnamed protein product [Allacma fusca]|uniref:Uncharacterized protein n=1 Tax=Allacma fusca TaxID=39272 RepID=A0A8J2NUB1_9HEXA|nr:unnamed protein product [Allacma fusca]
MENHVHTCPVYCNKYFSRIKIPRYSHSTGTLGLGTWNHPGMLKDLLCGFTSVSHYFSLRLPQIPKRSQVADKRDPKLAFTKQGTLFRMFLVSLLIAYLDTVRYFLKQRIPSASCHEKLLSYKKLMVLQNLVEFVLRQAFMVQATTYCFMTGIFASFGCLCLYGEIDNKVYASMLISYFAVTTFSYTFFTRTGKLVGLSSSYVRASFAGPSITKNVGPRASSGVDDVGTYSEQVGIRNQAEIRAYMKACRPLSVRVGNMGIVKKNQFLKMLSFIVIQTMRLLIMTKNSELT